MIDLNRKQQIILDHLDGMANWQIAAKMHMSKDTVNKYVKEYDEKKAALLASDPDADQKEIIQAFVEEPTYDAAGRGPRKVTPELEAEVEKCPETGIRNEKARGAQDRHLRVSQEKRFRCQLLHRKKPDQAD